MKEGSPEGHGKVADHSKLTSKTEAPNNFDDDYNEWELGIGELIIDLDADIEKNNEKANIQNNTTPVHGKTTRMNATVEHQATVDKGLKMKIKRKNVGTKSEAKHEIVKSDPKTNSVDNVNGNVGSGDSKSTKSSSEKATKGRSSSHHRKDKNKEKNSKTTSNSDLSLQQNGIIGNNSVSSGKLTNALASIISSNTGNNNLLSMDPLGLNVSVNLKMENKCLQQAMNNFTLKCEDVAATTRCSPPKKIKVDKTDVACSPVPADMKDVSICTSVGTMIEPECLGPCEPGTSVTLEGIVWHETEGGILVVNVTWRGKTYVGTLLDCTRHDWAPPRFCDSPVSDIDNKTPKGRGKRGRATTSTPLNDMSNYTETRTSAHSKLRGGKGRRGNGIFQAPPSPAKSDITPVSGNKRKGRPVDVEIPNNSSDDMRVFKRSRSNSRSTPTNTNTITTTTVVPPAEPSSPVLIECPEPNCSKKYKHINGLRYHQTHAHQSINIKMEPGMDESKDNSSDESCHISPVATPEKVSTSPSAGSPGLEPENARSVITKKESFRVGNDCDSGDASNLSNLSSMPDLSTLASVALRDPRANSSNNNSNLGNSFDDNSNSKSDVDNKFQDTNKISNISSHSSGAFQPPNVQVSCSGVSLSSSVSTTSVITTAPSSDSDRKSKNKLDSKDKLKPKLGARPIVPAPAPQVITLPTNVTHSGLSINQISPTLKPIQPKPTILGEPTVINPVLSGLKEKKTKHKKKSKEKEKEKMRNKGGSSPSCESKMDSKSNENSTLDRLNGNIYTKISDVAHISSKKDSHKSEHTQLNGTVRQDVGSPLQVNTSDNGNTNSDNVQSPAYSDISDANDAAPVLESEVPQPKEKEPAVDKVENSKSESNSPHVMPQYNVGYPFYKQPPYLVPSVPPHSSKSDKTKTESAKIEEKPKEEKKIEPEREKIEDPEPKKNRIEEPPPASAPQTPYQSSSQSKVMHSTMFGQYYLPGYNHPYHSMDSNYHMHLLSADPIYKQQCEKYMEDQERLHKEAVDRQNKERSNEQKQDELDRIKITPKIEISGKNSPAGPPDLSKQNMNIKSQERRTSIKPEKPESLSLKEKKQENHQIHKENIELKSHMESKPKYDNYDSMLFDRSEEMRRYYIFQDKPTDHSNLEMDKRKELIVEKTESKPQESIVKNPKDNLIPISKDQKDSCKKDALKPSKSSENCDLKLKEDKPRTPDDKNKNNSNSHENPISKSAGELPIVHSSYPQYMHHQYMTPHYTLPYDPNHPMYRGLNPVIMSPAYSGQPYLPPQMRYHIPPGENRSDLEKSALMSSNVHSSQEHNTKALDLLQAHANQYYSAHKIHELKDIKSVTQPNNRGKPSNSPSKPDGTSSIYDKACSPPAQRHLQTHHHSQLMSGFSMIGQYDHFNVNHADCSSGFVQWYDEARCDPPLPLLLNVGIRRSQNDQIKRP